MDKSLAASKKVMKNYLSELLTEEQPVAPASVESKAPDAKLEKLLETVKPKVIDDAQPELPISPRSEPIEAESEELITPKSQGDFQLETEKSYRKGSFQAMFFEVAGLTVAVPLIELGGIHNMDKTTPLMGKPDWFKGVMIHRDEKINVVDTAKWVMPEKCSSELLAKIDYQYVIMLSNSEWGLSAESLVDTVTLEQDDVKWLDENTKRPWLAGLVKDRKCALLDVESMIVLLAEGASINNNS